MSEKTTETIIDLLSTLEKSRELRPLARECGLTVKELRRRLGCWRRDLASEAAAGKAAGTQARKKTRTSAKHDFPEVTPALDLDESPLPAAGAQVMEIFTDGASKGNPGPASIGMVFCQQGGEALCGHAEAIGRATNNVAEYRAVIRALELATGWGVKNVSLFVDSELVARQLSGRYRVKSLDLRPLYQQVVFLTRKFKDFRVTHVPRADNAFADHLANTALKSR